MQPYSPENYGNTFILAFILLLLLSAPHPNINIRIYNLCKTLSQCLLLLNELFNHALAIA